MKFRLNSLVLALRREVVTIPFADVNYFWGEMGAGKTSIAQLIDYCLGGDIELTPAMQSEFVSAALAMSLERGDVRIERPRDSERVIAQWGSGDDGQQASIPARVADGEVIPGTGVGNLSDLLFWLSGVSPPRVRTSKMKDDAELRRLSIRDLFWYCYLDQDSMDSSFFYLEEKAYIFKQLKSRDVVRYVIGFHDERVAELEAQLDSLRGVRLALTSSLAGMVKVLQEVGVESEEQIVAKVAKLRERAQGLEKQIRDEKSRTRENLTTHAVETLRAEAIRLDGEIARIDQAVADLRRSIDNDLRHKNELDTLSMKFKRSQSAKAVLAGVAFEACPRCTQGLPERAMGICGVCGQEDKQAGGDTTEVAIVDKDAKARSDELEEVIDRHLASAERLQRERHDLDTKKRHVERERNEAMKEYDTAYLSNFLQKERERASLLQEAESWSSLVKLARAVEKQRKEISGIEVREKDVRVKLRDARTAAESDAQNLDRLKQLYLDCLIRAEIPGIKVDDQVEIPSKDFFPYITGVIEGGEQITSFATISSGGKKNLLKACFAIAIHRVAAILKAPLPELLIIDSAMKNISERVNRAQFEGFYRMLYELKKDELQATQMILIDKEFLTPEEGGGLAVASRQMRPGDPESPPLIPYYLDGK